jgi:hypothetical protein
MNTPLINSTRNELDQSTPARAAGGVEKRAFSEFFGRIRRKRTFAVWEHNIVEQGKVDGGFSKASPWHPKYGSIE